MLGQYGLAGALAYQILTAIITYAGFRRNTELIATALSVDVKLNAVLAERSSARRRVNSLRCTHAVDRAKNTHVNVKRSAQKQRQTDQRAEKRVRHLTPTTCAQWFDATLHDTPGLAVFRSDEFIAPSAPSKIPSPRGRGTDPEAASLAQSGSGWVERWR